MNPPGGGEGGMDPLKFGITGGMENCLKWGGLVRIGGINGFASTFTLFVVYVLQLNALGNL